MIDFTKMRRILVANKMLYSLSAAARILGLSAFSVHKVEEIENDLMMITDIEQNVRTVHKQYFLKDFVSIRQQLSRKLLIQPTQYNNIWIVTNPENKNRYLVRAADRGIQCKCRDYQKQQSAFGQGCCKHGYLVLKHLGYNDLSSYLADRQTVAS